MFLFGFWPLCCVSALEPQLVQPTLQSSAFRSEGRKHAWFTAPASFQVWWLKANDVWLFKKQQSGQKYELFSGSICCFFLPGVPLISQPNLLQELLILSDPHDACSYYPTVWRLVSSDYTVWMCLFFQLWHVLFFVFDHVNIDLRCLFFWHLYSSWLKLHIFKFSLGRRSVKQLFWAGFHCLLFPVSDPKLVKHHYLTWRRGN